MTRYEIWVYERYPDAEPERVKSLDDRCEVIDPASHNLGTYCRQAETTSLPGFQAA